MSKPSSEVKDPLGFQTLELFSKAQKFNKWLFQAVAPFCTGNILEIGSGIGNISKFLLSNFDKVTLSDLRNEYREILNQKFDHHEHLKGIHQIDLSIKDFEESYDYLLNKYDTVIALNVIEHISDSSLAVQNCKKLLEEHGRLIILVPAYQSLYNSLDSMLEHHTRYTKKSLSYLLENNGMNIIDSRYFNFAGILGWWLTGNLLKRKIIPAYQLNLFNRLIPLFRVIDRIIFYKSGLSVIVISEK